MGRGKKGTVSSARRKVQREAGKEALLGSPGVLTLTSGPSAPPVRGLQPPPGALAPKQETTFHFVPAPGWFPSVLPPGEDAVLISRWGASFGKITILAMVSPLSRHWGHFHLSGWQREGSRPTAGKAYAADTVFPPGVGWVGHRDLVELKPSPRKISDLLPALLPLSAGHLSVLIRLCASRASSLHVCISFEQLLHL